MMQHRPSVMALWLCVGGGVRAPSATPSALSPVPRYPALRPHQQERRTNHFVRLSLYGYAINI